MPSVAARVAGARRVVVAELWDRGCPARAVAFNICNRDGTVLRYSLVESRARRANVSVRGGCFCNPGAAEAAFGLDARVASCFNDLGAAFNARTLRRVHQHRRRRGADFNRAGE